MGILQEKATKNMGASKLPVFYKDKPLFGFDIGNGSVKIVQLGFSGSQVFLEGYGSSTFEPSALIEGEVTNYEVVASSVKELFERNLTGQISTDAVAVSLPVSHSFSRIISLPEMEDKDLVDAIRLEAEQYIPVNIDDLYLDYQLVEKKDGNMEFVVAAAPKRVVDSYDTLFQILGLEAVVMEPSILSVTRLVRHAEESSIPTLVIDCGATTTDLIIYNRSTVRVTGTIKFGGNTITQALMESMNLTEPQANTIKSKYGLELSKKQAEITEALNIPLKALTNDIKKIIRYFEDREKDEQVGQIIILGGGANLPGFSTYLTSALRIPTRLCGVWQNVDFGGLQPPNQLESSVYATAAGLALAKKVGENDL